MKRWIAAKHVAGAKAPIRLHAAIAGTEVPAYLTPGFWKSSKLSAAPNRAV
jgi:hypothetical protein